MGRITIVSGYETEQSVANLISYILYPTKNRCDIKGGSNLISDNNYSNCDCIIKQFLDVQRFAGLDFRNRAYQITYDYDPDTGCGSYKLIWGIAEAFCRYFKNFQTVYAIHDNTKFLHMHMILNNVPIYNDRQASYKLDYYKLELISSVAENVCLFSNDIKRETASSIADETLDIFYRFNDRTLTDRELKLYISNFFGDTETYRQYYGGKTLWL